MCNFLTLDINLNMQYFISKIKYFFFISCNFIYRIIGSFVLPIIENLPFVINSIFLLVLPTFISAYIMDKGTDSFLEVSRLNRDGAGVPFVFFMPFCFVYLISVILVLIKRYNFRLIAYIKILFYIILYLLDAINIFLIFNFKTMFSPMILQLVNETDPNESVDFFNTYIFSSSSLICYLILFLVATIILFVEKRFVRINFIMKTKLGILTIFLISIYMLFRSIIPLYIFIQLFKCSNPSEIESWYNDKGSLNTDTNTLTNLLYSILFMNVAKNDMDEAIKNTVNYKEICQITRKRNLNVVIVIGESFSKYHSSLYGYKLNTNPGLMDERTKNKLFTFSDVVSPYNVTSSSLKNIFSVNSLGDHEQWSSKPIFPAIFKRAGYKVYFWDNQKSFGKTDVFDYSLNSFLYNKNIVNSSYSFTNKEKYQYDMDLVKDFIDNSKISNNNLVIFHLYGQHIDAKKRFPSNHIYDFFSIKDIKKRMLSNKDKQIIADYDNATLYNDFVVCNIINFFRDKNTILLYFSDHGEEVYDYRNIIGRTHEKNKTRESVKYQYEIPFMIWCSDIFINRYPNIIRNIKMSLKKPFMTDNICQIMFGICGIKTKFYIEKRDLLSIKYQYPKRIIQDHLDFDSIMTKNLR